MSSRYYCKILIYHVNYFFNQFPMNSPNHSSEIADIALDKSNLVFVTGVQWWDEGKWKAVSAFQWQDIQYIVWPNGWGNAGHTVYYKRQKLDFHELPGGSIIEWVKVYLAKGKVIQISTLIEEMKKLQGVWIDLKEKIVIGWGAQVILKSFQQKLDADIEKLLWGNAVGTTKKWIGPAYAAQSLRVGFTINELCTMSDIQIQKRVDVICGLFSGLEKQVILNELTEERTKLQDSIHQRIVTIDRDDMMIHSAVQSWNNVLAEQSQSFLLGKEWWAYPYCTSSDTSIHGMMSYINIPYTVQPVVIGTMKAIMSKVWGGCLPTKMWHEPKYREFEKDFARQTGEVGVTTGRLRDLGWVDMLALRHATNNNPLTILLATKADVLATLADAQEQAHLTPEMRFYTDFTDPEDGNTATSWVVCQPNTCWTYDTIPLSQDIEKNIALYGEKIRTYLPEFWWPIFFWTGPEEHEIMKYNW